MTGPLMHTLFVTFWVLVGMFNTTALSIALWEELHGRNKFED